LKGGGVIKKQLVLLFLSIFTILITGCPWPSTGALKIYIDKNKEKAPAPEGEMDISFYQIICKGPYGSRFKIVKKYDDFERYILIWDLQTGDWEITINAVNSGSEILARDAINTTIFKDQIVEEFAHPLPVDGYGNLDTNIQWDTQSATDPELSAYLVLSKNQNLSPAIL